MLIIYANLDHQSVLSGHRGWISQFHQDLQLGVAQFSGKQVVFVKQLDVSDSADKEPALLKQVPRTEPSPEQLCLEPDEFFLVTGYQQVFRGTLSALSRSAAQCVMMHYSIGRSSKSLSNGRAGHPR